MAAEVKDRRRIACYGDKIAVIENGVVIKQIIIEEQVLQKEINRIIEEREVPLDVYHIFRRAVENLTDYKYYGFRGIPVIEGVPESIHDQPIYRKWQDYILHHEKIELARKGYIENLKAKKKFERENYLLLNSNNPNFKPYMSHRHKR